MFWCPHSPSHCERMSLHVCCPHVTFPALMLYKTSVFSIHTNLSRTVSPLHAKEFCSETVSEAQFVLKFNTARRGIQLTQLA